MAEAPMTKEEFDVKLAELDAREGSRVEQLRTKARKAVEASVLADIRTAFTMMPGVILQAADDVARALAAGVHFDDQLNPVDEAGKPFDARAAVARHVENRPYLKSVPASSGAAPHQTGGAGDPLDIERALREPDYMAAIKLKDPARWEREWREHLRKKAGMRY
ncbi:MAG: hypothetical protein HRF43_07490 [Phycisphaerae bacterium]|jgi:hypothetical protein